MKLAVRNTSKDPEAAREALGQMAASSASSFVLSRRHATVRLGKEAARAIADVLLAAARGEDVMVVPVDRWLTTQEAAELLGVSRQHLARRLDAGSLRVSSVRTGKHRRLRLVDVFRLREEQRLAAECAHRIAAEFDALFGRAR